MTSVMRQLSALGFVLLLLTGCAAQYVARGDEALAQRDHARAVRNYREALQRKPALASDADFAAKLKVAQSRAAFDRGIRLLDANDAVNAVTQFEEALRIDAGFAEARRKLNEAQRLAADQLHQRAIELADRGDLQQASQVLRQALAYNSQHNEAAAALQSIQSPTTIASPAVAPYAEGLAAAEKLQWQVAAVSYERAIAIDRNHLPARAARHLARDKLAESEQLTQRASKSLTAKAIGEAITLSDQALRIWPRNAAAQRISRTANERHDTTRSHYNAAIQAEQNRQWDAALSELAKAEAIYPGYPPLRGYRDRLLDSAAADHVAQGEALQRKGKLDDAVNAYREALRFRPKYDAARGGLASVAFIRGQAAEKGGLHGNALLYYLDAQEQFAASTYDAAVQRMRDALYAKARVNVAFDVVDAGGRRTARSDALDDYLKAVLDKNLPAVMQRVQRGNANQPSDYLVTVTVDELALDQRVIRSERKQFAYEAIRRVPNPAIPHLEHKVRSLELRVHRYESDYRTARRRYEHAKRAADHDRDHDDGKRKGDEKRGRERGNKGDGHGDLHALKREVDRAHRNLDHAVHELKQVRYDLSCAPAYVDEAFTAYWPFTESVYRKQGSMKVSVRIEDVAARRLVDRFAVAKQYQAEDTVIQNANPDIGLRRDGLDLPSDGEVVSRLHADVSSALSTLAAQHVANKQAAAYSKAAQDQAKEGKIDQAVEADVTAALLLEIADPKAGRAALDRIRRGE